MSDETPHHQLPSGEDQTTKPQGGHAEPAGSQPVEGYVHRPDEKHREAERKNWRVQNGLTAFGVIFAFIAAAGGAFSAYESSKAVVASQEGATQARRAADEAHNQVVEAHKQFEEAKRQADFTEQQLTLAKALGISNQTPNFQLGFQDLPLTSLVAGKKLSLRLFERNGGPGIALKVIARSNVAVLPFPLTKDSDLPTALNSELGDGISVLPSATPEIAVSVVQPGTLSQEDIDKTCETCDYRIFAYGNISYEDQFGNKYVKEFCGYVDQVLAYAARYVPYCKFHNGLEPQVSTSNLSNTVPLRGGIVNSTPP